MGKFKINVWYRGMSIASAKKVLENGYFNKENVNEIFFTPILEIGKAYAVQRNQQGILFECGVVGQILYSESPLHEFFYTKNVKVSADIIKKIYLVAWVDGERKIARELTKEELLKMEV